MEETGKDTEKPDQFREGDISTAHRMGDGTSLELFLTFIKVQNLKDKSRVARSFDHLAGWHPMIKTLCQCSISKTLQEVAGNNRVYRNEIYHSAAEYTQVLQEVASDPTLPRTKSVRCAVCGHGEAVFLQCTSSLFLAFWHSSGGNFKRGRHGTVLCMLQPKLWASVERLKLFYPEFKALYADAYGLVSVSPLNPNMALDSLLITGCKYRLVLFSLLNPITTLVVQASVDSKLSPYRICICMRST
ncbi:unnamed protein product [Dovyalis caffra]|uniref:Uncharacterized protein n=1 Tax=Dovyalis caffra TaxID=77055 RepID=A0AAV1R261_9ROSI|nr:unnamed protein product [Dovyalis caffra]